MPLIAEVAVANSAAWAWRKRLLEENAPAAAAVFKNERRSWMGIQAI